MHPFHFTHGIRTSSRTLRLWSIYSIMPLSELATFRPKVHHRPPSPMGVEQLTTAHERRAGLVARLVDAADLVLVGPKPPSSLPQIRSEADRHCSRQLFGTLEKEPSQLVTSTRAYAKSTQRVRSKLSALFKRMYGHAGGFKQHRNRSKKPKSARYCSSDANMTTIEMKSSV